MASRSLEDLQPKFERQVRALQDRAAKTGLDLLIYCTLRSAEEQAKLYRQSRPTRDIRDVAERLRTQFERPHLGELLLSVGPQYGPHVTNAAPGMSVHQYGLAIDAVPMRGGKPVWGTKDENDMALWQQYGAIAADELGLEWAGRWNHFREFPHVQDPDADWRKLIREYPLAA
jgi:peptidoglycan L-alanyl-D-glutamate endopeptidase CwlK